MHDPRPRLTPVHGRAAGMLAALAAAAAGATGCAGTPIAYSMGADEVPRAERTQPLRVAVMELVDGRPVEERSRAARAATEHDGFYWRYTSDGVFSETVDQGVRGVGSGVARALRDHLEAARSFRMIEGGVLPYQYSGRGDAELVEQGVDAVVTGRIHHLWGYRWVSPGAEAVGTLTGYVSTVAVGGAALFTGGSLVVFGFWNPISLFGGIVLAGYSTYAAPSASFLMRPAGVAAGEVFEAPIPRPVAAGADVELEVIDLRSGRSLFAARRAVAIDESRIGWIAPEDVCLEALRDCHQQLAVAIDEASPAAPTLTASLPEEENR